MVSKGSTREMRSVLQKPEKEEVSKLRWVNLALGMVSLSPDFGAGDVALFSGLVSPNRTQVIPSPDLVTNLKPPSC